MGLRANIRLLNLSRRSNTERLDTGSGDIGTMNLMFEATLGQRIITIYLRLLAVLEFSSLCIVLHRPSFRPLGLFC